jgi:hypothetical protein
MNVKLCCDLFNTLVRSTTSYVREVWVDFKKIKAIEIMYQGFFKSLLGVRKITNMSIVLAKFGKYPFEHFAWGQMLLYYNHMSTVTKDRILGNGASTCNDSCAIGNDCSIAARNGSWGNTHTSDPSSMGERSGKEPSALVQ